MHILLLHHLLQQVSCQGKSVNSDSQSLLDMQAETRACSFLKSFIQSVSRCADWRCDNSGHKRSVKHHKELVKTDEQPIPKCQDVGFQLANKKLKSTENVLNEMKQNIFGSHFFFFFYMLTFWVCGYS